MNRPGFAVLVPVHNEAAVLGRSVPALLQAAPGADLIWVCNGCTDGSAGLIRQLAGGRGRVIELPAPGKTAALNAAEAETAVFPRFYLDADVLPEPGCFEALLQVLQSGEADLVAPRIRFDTSAASPTARAITRTWLALPHGQGGAFHHLLGISARGRSAWAEFPDLLGDDIFVQAHIPPARRRIVPQARVTTWSPPSFIAWVRVRARWRRGERQLARLGLSPGGDPGQRGALLRMLGHPASFPGALGFILARLLAVPLAALPQRRWYSPRG